jgi:membrane-associated HD superfamily phosphohydrolase
VETKVCGRCKLGKNVDMFGRNVRTKTGLRSTCNDCRKIESKIYKEKNRHKRSETIKKYYEKNKEKIKEKTKEYLSNNHDKVKEIKLKSYHKNKEKYKERIKLYTQKNLDKRNSYEKNKKKADVVYRLKTLVRGRISDFFKSKKINKNNKTFEIVGCSPKLLKEHIEKQFKEGMSWDNYGLYGWHIDHIIPLSLAKTEEEVYKLCHYTNLQPLWAKENLTKSNKIL